MLELFFEMGKSVFWWDEEIKTSHVIIRPEIPEIADCDIPDTAGRKTRRRRTQAIARRYASCANAVSLVAKLHVKLAILIFLTKSVKKGISGQKQKKWTWPLYSAHLK